jgi:hypothetical protein
VVVCPCNARHLYRWSCCPTSAYPSRGGQQPGSCETWGRGASPLHPSNMGIFTLTHSIIMATPGDAKASRAASPCSARMPRAVVSRGYGSHGSQCGGWGARGGSPSRGSEASSASGRRPGLLRGQATDPDPDGVEAKVRPTRQPRASRKWARTTLHSERCTNTLRHRVARLECTALSCSKKRAHPSGAMKLFLRPYNLTRAPA